MVITLCASIFVATVVLEWTSAARADYRTQRRLAKGGFSEVVGAARARAIRRQRWAFAFVGVSIVGLLLVGPAIMAASAHPIDVAIGARPVVFALIMTAASLSGSFLYSRRRSTLGLAALFGALAAAAWSFLP